MDINSIKIIFILLAKLQAYYIKFFVILTSKPRF